MSLSKLPRSVGAPRAAAGTAATLMLLFGDGGPVNLLGMSLPAPIVYGTVVGAASGVTEMAKNHVVPMVTNDPVSITAIHLVQPAITGASTAVLGGIMSGFDGNLVPAAVGAFILGAGSQLVGNFAGEAIDKFVQGLIPSSTKSQAVML